MITLETDRTILRPLRTADCADVLRWAAVPENVQYMPWAPMTEKDAMEFLSNSEKYWAEEPVRSFEFGIVLKASGQLVGSCAIYDRDNQGTAELAWLLRRDHWKQGLATEVAGMLLRFGFEDLKMHRIFARCDAENYGSYRVMERNNMRREGYSIKSRRLRNAEPAVWVDECEYAILDEEYTKNHAIPLM